MKPGKKQKTRLEDGKTQERDTERKHGKNIEKGKAEGKKEARDR